MVSKIKKAIRRSYTDGKFASLRLTALVLGFLLFTAYLSSQNLFNFKNGINALVGAQTCTCTGDTQYNCGKYVSQAFCVQDPYCSWSCPAYTPAPAQKTPVPTRKPGGGGGSQTTPAPTVGGSAPKATSTSCTNVGSPSIKCDPDVPTSGSKSAPVTVIGDSLTVGAKTKLQALLPNASIDARVGRPWSEGVSILSQLKSSGKLAGVLVFALGTNSPNLTSADIQQVKNLASGSTVVFMTNFAYGDSTRFQSNNALIKGAKSSAIRVADWNALATRDADGPNTFAISTDPNSPRVHPNTTGYTALANLLAGQVPSSPVTNISAPAVPPSTNDCNGLYTGDISFNYLRSNFGDPDCSLLTKNPSLKETEKEKLYAKIAAADPDNLEVWKIIIDHESAVRPLAFNNMAIDPCGAWGLFQMNAHTLQIPGQDKPCGTQSELMTGDVNWEKQWEHAYRWNTEVLEPNGNKWCFWQIARSDNYGICLCSTTCKP